MKAAFCFQALFIIFVLNFTVPELIEEVGLRPDFEDGVINLDWSMTFRLNSIVTHYELERNGVLLLRSTDTGISLLREPTGISKIPGLLIRSS